MLSKEKCESALENLEEINLDIVLEELGYEKAERVSIYGINDYPTLEKQGDIEVFRELINEHFEPQPYKFEDLKDGIWVWDDVFKEVCYIASIINRKRMYVEYLESHCAIEPYRIMQFEEDRFFPVQKANEVTENVG